jgi:hypothetical protein
MSPLWDFRKYLALGQVAPQVDISPPIQLGAINNTGSGAIGGGGSFIKRFLKKPSNLFPIRCSRERSTIESGPNDS